MHYGFAIDQQRCIGCHTCSVACKIENNLPDEMWWNRILTDGGAEMDIPAGEFPNSTIEYVPVNCQHCENPACAKVCPVGATYRDPETGIVRQDVEKCIGCRMCVAACPYTGVRSFNWEEPQFMLGMDLGDEDVPAHQKHTVEKCTMCYQRVAKGQEPACVGACPARARIWGDLDDPQSEVSQMIAARSKKQLLPEKGTNPSVYYLV
ncbi:4Fe-4S dicluster domain-containing protein [Enterorhabdus sp. P55]|jgi:molybdopterin-containing oxidoreductase family iron-sulfur binding subunit|uniref:4Fe-4S dicluster domain-containing protein n=1 Tax=Enterorhabdus sp. P55 TaxID=2304571 RepID=UPI00136C9B3F|nr:4Fe-4S dicluster domain-containing protein [Enterorhabdus sp. P55]MCI8452908.1 4Fe-4S dicluster domain-containing protein [Eggerthellaceae bacterium]NBI31633.1 4Fe-4S dicluster domain-containing protein [Enterorhabdus sp. P55]